MIEEKRAMGIKILLAEDHELTRQGISFGFKKTEGFDIVGEAENGQQAVELTLEHKPDVVLMDLVMPVLNGIDATKIIKKELPNTKVLMLTSHSEKEKVLCAFSSGADAYCMKNIKLDRLINVIELTLEGAVWLDPSIAGYLMEVFVSSPNSAKDKSSYNNVGQSNESLNDKYADFNLTNREKEILKSVADGLSNKDISEKYTLSIYTVKNHVSSIIQKLAVDDRTQAAILALKENLI